MNRPLFSALAGAAVSLSLVACAHASAYNPDHLSAAEVAGVGEVCRSVMGLRIGTAQDVGCFDSLSRALSSLAASRDVQDAHVSCLTDGRPPQTAALATCTLVRSESRDGRRADPPVASIDGLALPGGKRSYAMTSNSDRRARERLSCAMIGLDPAGGAFEGCVADLAQTLFALDNPQT